MKLPSNQSAQATLPLGSRATEPPKPFIKWAGGKRQLVPELLRCVPEKYGTYFEPFLGGAALFFALRPQRAVLSDLNDRLIRAYRGVANDVERVISELSRWPHDREFFLNVRSTDTSRMSDADVAAWFIYLNRTAFNGLYRVNRDNQFNVPFGDYKNPTICDREVLRLASAALAACEVIQAVDFEDAVKAAREGDFVFLETNPYGQWLWIEDLTDLPITAAITDTLLSTSAHHCCVSSRSAASAA